MSLSRVLVGDPPQDLPGERSPALLPSSAKKRIATIAIPTRNRPRMLQRVISSLAAHLSDCARSATICVVDDSPAQEMQSANLGVICNARAKSSLAIEYANHKTVSDFARSVARESNVDQVTIDFALSNSLPDYISVGTCRNAALLATLGQAILFVDDDVLCRAVKIPGCDGHVSFAADGFQSWFFTDQNEIEQLDYSCDSLLEIHENALNMDWQTLAASNDEEARRMAPARTLHRMANPSARTVVSLMGIVGDAATNDPLIYFLQGGNTIARLTSTPESYQTALRNRLVLCGPAHTIVSDFLPCMSYCMAIDNGQILPPFFPVGRGEEFVFGALVNRCVPNALFAAIPRAILHLPQDPREFSLADAFERAGKLTVSETIAALVGHVRFTGDNVDSRLQCVSSHFLKLARLSDLDLKTYVHDVAAQVVRAQHYALERATEECSHPMSFFWKDLQKLKAGFVESLQSWDYSAPTDIGYGGQDQFREFLALFGNLMAAWPELVLAAERLHARGISPFQHASEAN